MHKTQSFDLPARLALAILPVGFASTILTGLMNEGSYFATAGTSIETTTVRIVWSALYLFLSVQCWRQRITLRRTLEYSIGLGLAMMVPAYIWMQILAFSRPVGLFF